MLDIAKIWQYNKLYSQVIKQAKHIMNKSHVLTISKNIKHAVTGHEAHAKEIAQAINVKMSHSAYAKMTPTQRAAFRKVFVEAIVTDNELMADFDVNTAANSLNFWEAESWNQVVGE